MNRPKSFEEVQTALNQLESRLAKIESINVDFHGRRIVNAGLSKDQFDYVVRKELIDLAAELKNFMGSKVAKIMNSSANLVLTGVAGSNYNTHLILTTASTTVNSPGVPLNGSIWTVRIDQDATGGRVVIWGTNVLLGPQIDVTNNSLASTMCLMTFIGYSTKWYCVSSMLGDAIV